MKSSDRGHSVARNAGYALASQVATALFTAALTLYLVRVLDPSGYGLFALAISAGSLALLPADFGIAQSTARYIAERRGDPGAMLAALVKGLRLKLVLTSTCAGVLVALAGPIASAYGNPALAEPLRWVFVALLGQSVMLLVVKAFVAAGRVDRQLWLVSAESAVELTTSIALVAAVGGATGAALGRAAAYSFGAILGIAMAWRLFRGSPLRIRTGGPRFRELMSYASALLVVDGAFALFSQLDVLLLGLLMSASSVGIYAAPLRLTTLLHYPGLAASSAVAPRLAKHPDHPPDVNAFSSALRFLVVLQAAVAVTILVWAEPITDLLLGSAYEESAGVLRALAPLVFLKGFGPLVSESINYVGLAKRRVPVAVGSVVVNVVLLLWLVPEIGVIGAAISVDVAYGIYVGAHLLLCRRAFDFDLRPLALVLLRATIAAGALALVLFLFGTGDLTVAEWIGGLLLGAFVFMAALLITRETSPAELSAARSWLSQRVRRA